MVRFGYITVPVLVAVLLNLGCGESGSLPNEPFRDADLRLIKVRGSEQYGVLGHTLTDSLVVRVESSGAPVEGVVVEFGVREGVQGLVSDRTVVTGPGGRAGVRLALGLNTGVLIVSARIPGLSTTPEVEYMVFVTGPPVIESVTPRFARAGSRLTIRGANFSPIAEHNQLTVGGVSVPVLTATNSLIEAEMPPVDRLVPDMTVVLTGAASAPHEFRAQVFSPHPEGTGTITLPFSSGDEQYLIIVESPVSGFDEHRIEVLASEPVEYTSLSLNPEATPFMGTDHVDQLMAGVRVLKRSGVSRARHGLEAAATREFNVFNHRTHRYEVRSADLVYTGEHSSVYLDRAVSADEVSPDAAVLLGESFEHEVYDPIRAMFGEESDVDGDGRTILLLTPVINDANIQGAFDPADLSNSGFSNGSEVLYLGVPDPTGRFGRRTFDTIERKMREIVGTSAHEFVHLIHTNERLVKRNLDQLSCWVGEGLAHLGELATGFEENVQSFWGSYIASSTRNLSIASCGFWSRGASLLFLARLIDRFGTDVIGRVVRAPATEARTIELATGEPFALTFHDFALATYNELFPVGGLEPGYEWFDVWSAWEPVFDEELGRDLLVARGSGTREVALTSFQGTISYWLVVGEESGGDLTLSFQVPPKANLHLSALRID